MATGFSGHWSAYWDENEGQHYFVHGRSGVTQWRPPIGFDTSDLSRPVDEGYERAVAIIQRAVRRWRELHAHPVLKHLDLESGRYYYVNTRTGETSWDKPAAGAPMCPVPEARRQGHALELATITANKSKKMQERSALVQMRQAEWQGTEGKRLREAKEAEASRRHNLWMHAIELAAETGELNMSWKKLGDVHPAVYSFKEDYGFPLRSLRLVGHDMAVLPPEVGWKLTNLTSLSLTSNSLEALPDSLCTCTLITELNLLRNKLRLLPLRIGDLAGLTRLHLSSNRLVALPPTFGNITKLDKITLECNSLTRMPETLSRMSCKTLNLNANKLVALPRCLRSMSALTQLTCCDNAIRSLPRDIGENICLETLHLSNNRLLTLPESLCLMPRLKSLWLDHNQMSALPWNIFELSTLSELRMDGNPDMILPTIDVIFKGAAAVRTWAKLRHEHALFIRKQNIVTAIQDILDQVARNKLCSSAFLEPQMERYGDLWYAVIMDHFWDETLPAVEQWWMDRLDRGERIYGMREFPYTREETELVLSTFKDPYGGVLRERETCLFHRCGCINKKGKRRVCVPPEPGWMCRRRATLIKCNIVLESEREERERKRRAVAQVEEAIETAKAAAVEYCKSDDGKVYFFNKARKTSAKVMAVRHAQRAEATKDLGVAKAQKRLQAKFDKDKKRWLEDMAKEEKKVRASLERLEAQSDEQEGWARDQTEAEIDRLMEHLQHLPQEELIRTAQEALEAKFDEIEGKAAGKEYSGMSRLSKFYSKLTSEHKELIQELEVDLEKKYTERLVGKARAKVQEEHRRMDHIRQAWQGLGVESVFMAWRQAVKMILKQRRRDARHATALLKQKHESTIATVKLAHWYHMKWGEELTDVWSDKAYWQHADNPERVRWDKPLLPEFIPKEFTMPEELKGLTHEQLILDEEPYDNASDASADSESGSESGSESDSSDGSGFVDDRGDGSEDEDDEDGGEDGDAPALEMGEDGEPLPIADGDDAAEGQLVATGGGDADAESDADGDGQLVATGGGDADSDDGGGAIVLRQSRSESAIVVPPRASAEELADEGLDDTAIVSQRKANESDDAVVRAARMRRRHLQRMERERKIKRGEIVVETDEAAPPTTGELMNMVGFDANKEYTSKQLTTMAKKAVAVEKRFNAPPPISGRIMGAVGGLFGKKSGG